MRRVAFLSVESSCGRVVNRDDVLSTATAGIVQGVDIIKHLTPVLLRRNPLRKARRNVLRKAAIRDNNTSTCDCCGFHRTTSRVGTCSPHALLYIVRPSRA